MSKFAPARDDGRKPWLVTISEWGRQHTRIEWADSARQAEYQAAGRMRYVSARARRARVEDMPEDMA